MTVADVVPGIAFGNSLDYCASMSIRLEQAVLDLARLGIKGDAASVEQFVRRLIRRLDKESALDPEFRAELASTLVLRANAHGSLRSAMPSPVDPASFMQLLKMEELDTAPAPVLGRQEEEHFREIVLERSASAPLFTSGLEPTKTVLLTGSPGVGKTMSARYLAYQLRLPLLTLDLAAVVSSYLGRTGQNLRQLLVYARGFPCVLLLDEFDALAKRRDDPTDIGELKRIVNVLLLELEEWPTHGVLVASTNHPELLDRAVWRRFDRVIQVPLPDAELRQRILERVLSDLELTADKRVIRLLAEITSGMSGSDLTRTVRMAARRRAMARGERVEAYLVTAVLEALPDVDHDLEAARMRFIRLADANKMSHRSIARLLGVSHVTIGNWLGGAEKPGGE